MQELIKAVHSSSGCSGHVNYDVPSGHGALRYGSLPLVFVARILATNAEDPQNKCEYTDDQQRRSGHLERIAAHGGITRPIGYDGHDQTYKEQAEGEHHHYDDGRLDSRRSSGHGASRQVALSVLHFQVGGGAA